MRSGSFLAQANAPQRACSCSNRVQAGIQEVTARISSIRSSARSTSSCRSIKTAAQAAKLGQPLAKVAKSAKLSQPLNELLALTVEPVGEGVETPTVAPRRGGSLLGKLGNFKTFVGKKKEAAAA